MVEIILASFPEYIKVSDLPHDDINYKVSFLCALLCLGCHRDSLLKQLTNNKLTRKKMEDHISVDYLLSIGRLSFDYRSIVDR